MLGVESIRKYCLLFLTIPLLFFGCTGSGENKQNEERLDTIQEEKTPDAEEKKPEEDTRKWGLAPLAIRAPDGVITGEAAYIPRNMTDTVLTTWWTPAGTYRSGKGAWVEMESEWKHIIKGILIHPGAHDPALPVYGDVFPLNNRIKRLRITLPQVNPIDLFYNLPDTDTVMCLRFPWPVSSGIIRLEVMEVYEGRRWHDLCISHLGFVTQIPEDALFVTVDEGTSEEEFRVQSIKSYTRPVYIKASQKLQWTPFLYTDYDPTKETEASGYEFRACTQSLSLSLENNSSLLYEKTLSFQDVFDMDDKINDRYSVFSVDMYACFTKPAWHVVSVEWGFSGPHDALPGNTYFLMDDQGRNILPPSGDAHLSYDEKYLVWEGKDSTQLYDFKSQQWVDYKGYQKDNEDVRFIYLEYLEKGIALGVLETGKYPNPEEYVGNGDIIAFSFLSGRLLKQWNANCIGLGLHTQVLFEHEDEVFTFMNGDEPPVVIKESEIYSLVR